ncbi:hypothetical protein JVU11DRAFT_8067 [Chiua virens]|nr:hypothetical protein JVU11DRAFT_8067 [Chiua virens]
MAPAAANYYSPPTHTPSKQRGHRICDACGAIENPSIQKFRYCGGCTPECQKSHWHSHKTICQHTVAQVSGAKQHALSTQYPDENLVKHLRKFTSTHSSLLGWAGFQALQLKRLPVNIRQNALLIELNYNSHAESLHRFSVVGTHIVPRSYVTSHDPLVAADIDRREERCRRSGGIGTLVILVQCAGISQVMPVEVDPPSKITWDSRDDWSEVLRHFVESGRTDFKPISTTARGIVYG